MTVKELSQEVENLKIAIDHILIRNGTNYMRVGELRRAFFVVCREILPDDVYKGLCADYLSHLKEDLNHVASSLDKLLFFPEGQSLKLRCDTELEIARMEHLLGIAKSND